MSNKYQMEIDAFMDTVKAKNGHEPEFLQAVHEVAVVRHHHQAAFEFVQKFFNHLQGVEV